MGDGVTACSDEEGMLVALRGGQARCLLCYAAAPSMLLSLPHAVYNALLPTAAELVADGEGGSVDPSMLELETSMEEVLDEGAKRLREKSTWKLWQWAADNTEFFEAEAFRQHVMVSLLRTPGWAAQPASRGCVCNFGDSCSPASPHARESPLCVTVAACAGEAHT